MCDKLKGENKTMTQSGSGRGVLTAALAVLYLGVYHCGYECGNQTI